MTEPTPAPAPGAPTNVDDEDLDPELRTLLLGADLVILGDVEITACRGGCLGHVAVRELVASSIVIDGTIAKLDFITAPPKGGMAAGGRAIVFAYQDPTSPRRWRLMLPRDRSLGLDPRRADEIRAAHAALPKATNPRDVESLADALAILRAHDQTRWNGAPIVDPARRVFENLDLRGLGKNDLVALIGAPVNQTAHPTGALWEYTFHDGEQGVMPRIYLAGGNTVSHVDVQYGQ